MIPVNKAETNLGTRIDRVHRVMIVDDHELYRYGLRNLLSTIQEFEVVVEASSCQDALAQLDTTPVDLAFLDLSLPDGDALSLIRTMKQHISSPDIIVLVATLNDTTLFQAILAGASGYITKNIPAADLARILKGYRRGELAMLSSVAARLIHLLVQKYQDVKAELDMQRTDRVIPPTVSIPGRLDVAGNGKDAGVPAPPLHLLTPQEDKILQLLQLGHSNKEIATRLAISHFTVGKHVQNILRKLGAINRTQAVSYTLFEGGIQKRQ